MWRIAILFLLALLSGCQDVTKADIANAIRLCEGHHGLQEVRSVSPTSVDVYCNSGAQFTSIPKIKDE
jgi:hypothetical protein